MKTFDASVRAAGLIPLEVFRSLNQQLGDYVVIGSIARELWAHVAGGLPRGRLTEDLDVSIAVESTAEWRHRAASLDGPHGNGVRYLVNETAVDVLPYGGIAKEGLVEQAEGVILDVRGMAEAAECACEVTLAKDLTVRFATLSSMVALKIVAWQIRKSYTNKDADDLATLLDASHEGPFADECWDDEHAGERWAYELSLMGPYRIGRQISVNFGEETLSLIASELNEPAADLLAHRMPPRLIVRRRDQLMAVLAGIRADS